ncbi:MAG: serine/threonine-protein kinase [Bdellovibrionota bacterium]
MSNGEFEDLQGLENDYDQIQKVAIGGMAEVYRGRQKNLDRPVAIKRIREEYRNSKDLKERFKREARSSANLLHHNLAHVYDYRVVGDESYIIMEYIDGVDLAQLLERAGALPIDVATMIAVKILIGLTQVHSHGMIHRDIKPDNIRITMRGEVKIMDFGIALDPGEMNLTQPGILIGSPHYLAPEQILGDRIDTRADLFAFGITFYEMLTGTRPFYERDGKSVYMVIKSGKYDKLETKRTDIPAFLKNIVEKCLEMDPADRPASSDSVAQSLQEFLMSHYSLSFESRLRKFLMEQSLLKGNPSMIEVQEKTLPPIKAAWWKPKNLPSRTLERIAFVIVCLGLLAFALRVSVFQRARDWIASPVENPIETTPIVEKKESTPKTTPRPRVHRSETPSENLPGSPVSEK